VEGRIVISPVIIDADGTIYLQTIEHLPGLSAVLTDHCKLPPRYKSRRKPKMEKRTRKV